MARSSSAGAEQARGEQSRRHQQDERPGEVELLLHAQRPVVQQRRRRHEGEIVGGLDGEAEVGHVQGGGSRVASHLRQAQRREDQCGGGQRDHDDHQRSGQQAAHAPRVEGQQVDLAGGPALAQQQAGDEEARDDVEDVDPDEASRRGRQADVEEQHGDDGHRAQALDIRPEVLLAVSGAGGLGRSRRLRHLAKGVGTGSARSRDGGPGADRRAERGGRWWRVGRWRRVAGGGRWRRVAGGGGSRMAGEPAAASGSMARPGATARERGGRRSWRRGRRGLSGLSGQRDRGGWAGRQRWSVAGAGQSTVSSGSGSCRTWRRSSAGHRAPAVALAVASAGRRSCQWGHRRRLRDQVRGAAGPRSGAGEDGRAKRRRCHPAPS